MGLVIPFERRPAAGRKVRRSATRQELPLVLARLLEAGATDFTRVALDAWGKHELEPEELLELCETYASVAGFENLG